MKVIDLLDKGIRKGSIRLLKIMIEANKYLTITEIRKKDRRNQEYVKRDIERFFELGWLKSAKRISLVGRNKAPILFERYKINLKNPVIKALIKKIKEVDNSENGEKVLP